MGKFDTKYAARIIADLIEYYQIKVVKTSAIACGLAWIKRREIKIPLPTNLEKFCVGLHEIGHIVADKQSYPAYRSEYIAETYALEMARAFGFDTSDYEFRAKNYVLMKLAKAHNRGLDLQKVSKEILDFTEFKEFYRWEDAKVFVHYNDKPVFATVDIHDNILDERY